MAFWHNEDRLVRRRREILDVTIGIPKRFKLLLTLHADGFSPADIAQFYHDEYRAVLTLYGSHVKALQEAAHSSKAKPLTVADVLGLCSVLKQALLSTPSDVDTMHCDFLWSEILAFVQPTVDPAIRLAGVGLLALFVHVFVEDPSDDRLQVLVSALEWGPFLRAHPHAAVPEMPHQYRLPAAFVPTADPSLQLSETDALKSFEAVIDMGKGIGSGESQHYGFWWDVMKRWLLRFLYPTESRLLAAVPTEPPPGTPWPCPRALHRLLLQFLLDGLACTLPLSYKCAALLGTVPDTFITWAILRYSFTYGLPTGRQCIFTTLEVLVNWVAWEPTGFPVQYHGPANFHNDVDSMCIDVVLLASGIFDMPAVEAPREAAEAYVACCFAVFQIYLQASRRADLRRKTHERLLHLYHKTVQAITARVVVHPIVVDVAWLLMHLMWLLNTDPLVPCNVKVLQSVPMVRHGHSMVMCLMRTALMQLAAVSDTEWMQFKRNILSDLHSNYDELLRKHISLMCDGVPHLPRPTDPVVLAFHDALALDGLGNPAMKHGLLQVLFDLDADQAGKLWHRLLSDLYLKETNSSEVASGQVAVIADVVQHLVSFPFHCSADPQHVPPHNMSFHDLNNLISQKVRRGSVCQGTFDSTGAVLEIMGPFLLRVIHSPINRDCGTVVCETLCRLLTCAAHGVPSPRLQTTIFYTLATKMQEPGYSAVILKYCFPATEQHVNLMATQHPNCSVLLMPILSCAQQVLRRVPSEADAVSAALRAVMTVTAYVYQIPGTPTYIVQENQWTPIGYLWALRQMLVDILQSAPAVLKSSNHCIHHIWAVLLLLLKEVENTTPSARLVRRLLNLLCVALMHRRSDVAFAAHASLRCFIAFYVQSWAVDPGIIAFVHGALCTAILMGLREYRSAPRGAVLISMLLTLKATVLATPSRLLLTLRVPPTPICAKIDRPSVPQRRRLMSLVADTLSYAINSFPMACWEVCKPRDSSGGVPIAHTPVDLDQPSHGLSKSRQTVLFIPATFSTCPPTSALWWCDSTGNLVHEMEPVPGTASGDIRDLARCIMVQFLEQVGSTPGDPARLTSHCRAVNSCAGVCFHLSLNNRLVSCWTGSHPDEVCAVSHTPVATYSWSAQCCDRALVQSPFAKDQGGTTTTITPMKSGLQNTNLSSSWEAIQTSHRWMQHLPSEGPVSDPPELVGLLHDWPTSTGPQGRSPFPSAMSPHPGGTSGDPVRQLAAASFMDLYAEKKGNVCVVGEAALYPLLSKLDTVSPQDVVHVAVLYAAQKQGTWQQAFRNNECSQALMNFLETLGKPSPAITHTGPVGEPLILSHPHTTMPIYTDRIISVLFHVLPHLPATNRTSKLDHCDLIMIWSESLCFMVGDALNHRPKLRICPLPSDMFYIMSNSSMGPAVSGTLVDQNIASQVILQTTMNVKLGCGKPLAHGRLQELYSFTRSITDMTRRTLPRLTLCTTSPSPLDPSTPCNGTEPPSPTNTISSQELHFPNSASGS